MKNFIKNKKPVRHAAEYSLKVSVDSMLYILRKDDTRSTGLYTKLMDVAGVLEVDYNGHFGPFIFIKITAKHDAPETWKRIFAIVNSYLEGSENG